MAQTSARDTPVMRQHAEVKRAYPDTLIFFRLGDFYELFGQDALVAAKLLELTLTSRNKGAADEIPMCGVPHHAAHVYLGRLLEAGHKVAICEQMADPAKCKGIVPRQVVRVLTPGLVTDRDQLEAGSNNWLVTFESSSTETALALLDISTGELSSMTLPDAARLLAELARLSPRECLYQQEQPGFDLAAFTRTIQHQLPRTVLRTDPPLHEHETAEELQSLAAQQLPNGTLERRALARVLRFARLCMLGKDQPLLKIVPINASEHLIIDEVTQGHLELVVSMRGDKSGTYVVGPQCDPDSRRHPATPTPTAVTSVRRGKDSAAT